MIALWRVRRGSYVVTPNRVVGEVVKIGSKYVHVRTGPGGKGLQKFLINNPDGFYATVPDLDWPQRKAGKK